MSFAKARNAINTLIATNWTGPKLVFDNVVSPDIKTAEFCRVNILPSAANPASIGASQATTRSTGNVIVQVFVKENIGIKRVDEIVELVKAKLQYQTLRGDNWSLIFRSAVPNTIGQRESYYQVNVVVQYSMDAK